MSAHKFLPLTLALKCTCPLGKTLIFPQNNILNIKIRRLLVRRSTVLSLSFSKESLVCSSKFTESIWVGHHVTTQGILTEGQGSVQLTSLSATFCIAKNIDLCYKTNSLNEEVYGTEPNPLVGFSWTTLWPCCWPNLEILYYPKELARDKTSSLLWYNIIEKD